MKSLPSILLSLICVSVSFAGNDITVVADGKPRTYDIEGSDGSNGYNGTPGWDAQCPDEHPQSGGDGGAGGDGGNGGDGGDFTVYYAVPEHLKVIRVKGSPGAGGYGGAGGSGGYGCNGGSNGSPGPNGSDGSPGAYGKVRLINQLDPLMPVQPKAKVKMEEMEKAPFELSEHNWETRNGTKALFAPKTALAEKYDQYLSTTELTYSLRWKAAKPLSDFKGKILQMDLKNGGVVDFTLPSQVWLGGEETGEAGERVFTFVVALWEKEVFNLSKFAGTGQGAGTMFSFEDKSSVSEIVKTELSVEFFTKAALFWYRRYHGKVPAELMTISANKVEFALGKLPIPSKYLVPGVRTFVRITAKRILGNKSGTKTLTAYYTIPK